MSAINLKYGEICEILIRFRRFRVKFALNVPPEPLKAKIKIILSMFAKRALTCFDTKIDSLITSIAYRLFLQSTRN